MALDFKRPPKASLKALQEGMELFEERIDMLKSNANVSRETIAKDMASKKQFIKVHIMSLNDIVSGEGFQKAVHSGWKYFTDDNKAIEVHYDEDGNNHRLAEMNEGVHIKNVQDSIKLIRKEKMIRGKHYEISLLVIPGLCITALWLHHKDGNNDLVVPVKPLHPILKKSGNSIFSSEEFIQLLKEEAKKIMDFYDVQD